MFTRVRALPPLCSVFEQSLTTLNDPRAVDEWLAQGPVALQPGGVGKLSTEVLDMIFQEILDDKSPFVINLLSCICFALGCKRLLTVGKRHILDGLIKHYVRAADCRLVCLGAATNATDQAPPGMLTEEEVEEIATTKVPAEDDQWAIAARNEDGADPDLILERCLYEFAMEFYDGTANEWWERNWSLAHERHAIWERLGAEWVLYECRDPVQLRDRMMFDALASGATYPPGPKVLLNLVKGEYVRDAALVVLGKGFNRVTLAHAMLSRICYSLDPGVADEYCGEEFVGRFGKGPWAGDRFCIRSEDDMPVPQAGSRGFTEWTDVTEEVNRLLGNLWRAMGRDVKA